MWVCLELLIGSKFFQLRTVHTYIYIYLFHTLSQSLVTTMERSLEEMWWDRTPLREEERTQPDKKKDLEIDKNMEKVSEAAGPPSPKKIMVDHKKQTIEAHEKEFDKEHLPPEAFTPGRVDLQPSRILHPVEKARAWQRQAPPKRPRAPGPL